MVHMIPREPVKKQFSRSREKRRGVLTFFLGRRTGSRRARMVGDYYGSQRGPRIPRVVYMVIVFVAVLLIGQSIFHLPLFRIEAVSIRGLKYVPETDVRAFIDKELAKRRFVFFRNNNYFIIALDRLRQGLEERFYVTITSVTRHFPRGLQIDIDERISGFVLQTPEQYILIDTNGEWVGAVDGPQGRQHIIADERALYGTVIPLNYLEVATSIIEGWEGAIRGVHINKLHLNDDRDRMTVSTDRDFRIYFSLSKDVDQQLIRLATYLQEADITQPREYIDLRFDENLYIK